MSLVVSPRIDIGDDNDHHAQLRTQPVRRDGYLAPMMDAAESPTNGVRRHHLDDTGDGGIQAQLHASLDEGDRGMTLYSPINRMNSLSSHKNSMNMVNRINSLSNNSQIMHDPPLLINGSDHLPLHNLHNTNPLSMRHSTSIDQLPSPSHHTNSISLSGNSSGLSGHAGTDAFEMFVRDDAYELRPLSEVTRGNGGGNGNGNGHHEEEEERHTGLLRIKSDSGMRDDGERGRDIVNGAGGEDETVILSDDRHGLHNKLLKLEHSPLSSPRNLAGFDDPGHSFSTATDADMSLGGGIGRIGMLSADGSTNSSAASSGMDISIQEQQELEEEEERRRRKQLQEEEDDEEDNSVKQEPTSVAKGRGKRRQYQKQQQQQQHQDNDEEADTYPDSDLQLTQNWRHRSNGDNNNSSRWSDHENDNDSVGGSTEYDGEEQFVNTSGRQRSTGGGHDLRAPSSSASSSSTNTRKLTSTSQTRRKRASSFNSVTKRSSANPTSPGLSSTDKQWGNDRERISRTKRNNDRDQDQDFMSDTQSEFSSRDGSNGLSTTHIKRSLSDQGSMSKTVAEESDEPSSQRIKIDLDSINSSNTDPNSTPNPFGVNTPFNPTDAFGNPLLLNPMLLNPSLLTTNQAQATNLALQANVMNAAMQFNTAINNLNTMNNITTLNNMNAMNGMGLHMNTNKGMNPLNPVVAQATASPVGGVPNPLLGMGMNPLLGMPGMNLNPMLPINPLLGVNTLGMNQLGMNPMLNTATPNLLSKPFMGNNFGVTPHHTQPVGAMSPMMPFGNQPFMSFGAPAKPVVATAVASAAQPTPGASAVAAVAMRSSIPTLASPSPTTPATPAVTAESAASLPSTSPVVAQATAASASSSGVNGLPNPMLGMNGMGMNPLLGMPGMNLNPMMPMNPLLGMNTLGMNPLSMNHNLAMMNAGNPNLLSKSFMGNNFGVTPHHTQPHINPMGMSFGHQPFGMMPFGTPAKPIVATAVAVSPAQATPGAPALAAASLAMRSPLPPLSSATPPTPATPSVAGSATPLPVPIDRTCSFLPNWNIFGNKPSPSPAPVATPSKDASTTLAINTTAANITNPNSNFNHNNQGVPSTPFMSMSLSTPVKYSSHGAASSFTSPPPPAAAFSSSASHAFSSFHLPSSAGPSASTAAGSPRASSGSSFSIFESQREGHPNPSPYASAASSPHHHIRELSASPINHGGETNATTIDEDTNSNTTACAPGSAQWSAERSAAAQRKADKDANDRSSCSRICF